MTEDTIPVPAESARQLAISAAEDIPRLRENGLKATARNRQRYISEVMEATAGHDGEFVSLSEAAVSDLAAGANIFNYHKEAATTFLEQYNVW